MEEYLKRARQKGYKDKYTNRAPSKEAIKAAEGAAIFFKMVKNHKEVLKNAEEAKEKYKDFPSYPL